LVIEASRTLSVVRRTENNPDCLGWDVLLSMKRVPKIGLTSYDVAKPGKIIMLMNDWVGGGSMEVGCILRLRVTLSGPLAELSAMPREFASNRKL